MNKFLRIISTAVVGIGLILLFVYLGFHNSIDKSEILNQPSYYTIQNYWWLLFAGCGCVAFSIVSCFLAWNKMMDEKIEILPNAVAADKSELLSWLTGSSLDTSRKAPHKERPAGQKAASNGLDSLLSMGKTVTEKCRQGISRIAASVASGKTGTEEETSPLSCRTEFAAEPSTQADRVTLNTEVTVCEAGETLLSDGSTVMEAATEKAEPDTLVLAETAETLLELDDGRTVMEQP